MRSDGTTRTKLWTSRALSAIVSLFLLFDSVIHLMVIGPVVDSFNQLGYPVDTAMALGVVELICLALYLFPRTSIFGAILLTGYLGGAIATQIRAGAPLFSIIFPIFIALFLWGGLFLLDGRLRALMPLRR